MKFIFPTRFFSTLRKRYTFIKSTTLKLSYLSKNKYRILGIETSCDDTSVAIVDDQGVILGECTRNQFHVHEPMGGIVPDLASKSHMANLPNVISQTLKDASLLITDVDVFAFTRGPGLATCLSVGTNATKTLAAALRKPLVGVHHMEAHALTVRMTKSGIGFPYLAFLLSGGHTLIIIVHGVNQYTQLASTLDESIGQTYDKVARELGICWNPAPKLGCKLKDKPGNGGGPGPALERVALNGNENKYKLTIPLNRFEKRLNANFSFSGLRAQVTQLASKLFADSTLGEREVVVADLAASFQFTAVAHLCLKLNMAFEHCRKMGIYPSALVASGGVASNFTIRKRSRFRLEETAATYGVSLECPPAELCTDNGAMIAWAGWERFRLGLVDPTTIDLISDWPLETLKRMYPQPR